MKASDLQEVSIEGNIYVMKSQLLAYLLENAPKKKECFCSEDTKDAWGCDCGADVWNACKKEYDEYLKQQLGG